MRFQPIFRRDRVRSKIRITQHVPFDRNERDALFRGTELSKLRLTRLHELPAKDHRPKIHFINPLERLNGEIKRYTTRRDCQAPLPGNVGKCLTVRLGLPKCPSAENGSDCQSHEKVGNILERFAGVHNM
jgi:hypothetical protein